MSQKPRKTLPACLIAASTAPVFAGNMPVLPDWTAATFASSSSVATNPYYPLMPNTLSVFEGFDDGEFERIETLVTTDTINILGVENRVIRDTAYLDGLLVEIAEDWYAEDTAGNVWYFGEHVVNYNYDGDGNLIGTDNEGSWTADGVTNLPGIIMLAEPAVGDEYYQEFAPGVAFDFAYVNGLDGVVDIDFGLFTNVLHTSEGNLFDGPGVAENKLYAPGFGLVLIQGLDDEGNPESSIPLIEHGVVPAPGALSLLGLGAFAQNRRRRVRLIG